MEQRLGRHFPVSYTHLLEAREMSEKAQYRTRQITELENYLCSMEGKHVTVSDICKYFKSQGISIGTTTVYRQLDRMVEQGLVAKYVVDGTSSACFEYLGHDEHCHKHICFHCKCEKCGKAVSYTHLLGPGRRKPHLQALPV